MSDSRYTRAAWTRRDGAFRIRDVDATGRYLVGVSHPGFDSVELAYDLPVAEPVPIVLPRPRFVSGRIVDVAGRPVEGAWNNQDIRSDAGGRFRLRLRTGGEIRAIIEAPGFQQRFVSESSPPENGRLLVTLRKGHRIAGTVLDLDGRPLPAVRIKACKGDDIGRGWSRSDIAGRFLLDGLEEGRHSIIGYVSGRIFETDVAALTGAEDVVLREIKGDTVAGRVVDAEGRGVPAFLVAVLSGVDTSEHLEQDYGVNLADGSRSAWSAEDGHLRIDKLLGDEFVLHVHTEGFWCEYVALPIPGVRAGATDMKISARRALLITGRIKGKDGRAHPDLRVIARPDLSGLPVRDAYTAADGKFELRGLHPTMYRLRVETRKGEDRGVPMDVAAGAGDVEIVLE